MELLIFEKEKFRRDYNCNLYDLEEIPLENRRQVVLGTLFVILSVVFEILYIPCVISISKHLNYTSFKYMYFIGIIDVLALPICGFTNGILAVYGVVYCSAPTLVYVDGILGTAFWFAESWTAIFLALNRCIENFAPSLAEFLYRGNRAWYWLIPIAVYEIFGMFFGNPILWNSYYFSWFYNPHIGYIDDFGLKFHFYQHTFHNIAVFLSLTALNFVFVFTFPSRRFLDKKSKIPFMQLAIITFINTIGTAIFVFMQYIPVPLYLIALGNFSLLLVHGLPSIVYLSLNRTVRHDCFRMLAHFCGINAQNFAASSSSVAMTNNGKTSRITPVSRPKMVEKEADEIVLKNIPL